MGEKNRLIRLSDSDSTYVCPITKSDGVFMQDGNTTLTTKMNEVTSQLEQIDNKKADEVALVVERERISNLIAHNNNSDGNSELLDVRVGFNGKTYSSAGESVRSQIKEVTEKSNIFKSSNTWKKYETDVSFIGNVFKDIKIYTDLEMPKFYIQGLSLNTSNSIVTFKIGEVNYSSTVPNTVCTYDISKSELEAKHLENKDYEIIFSPNNNSNISAKAIVNFSKIDLDIIFIHQVGFNYDYTITGLNPFVATRKNLNNISNIFKTNNTWLKYGTDISFIGKAIKDIKIYSNLDIGKFYIQGVALNTNSNLVTFKIGEVNYTGSIPNTVCTYDISKSELESRHSENKEYEVFFNPNNNSNISAKALINFSELDLDILFVKQLNFNWDYTITGLNSSIVSYSNNSLKKVVAPAKIPCVIGKEVNLYFDNILLNKNINNVEAIRVENLKYSEVFKNHLVYKPTATDFSNATIKIYENNTKDYSYASDTVSFIPVSKEAGNGRNLNYLQIGDSLTDNNKITEELLNLFSDDVANIELLGTRGIGTNKHEGRSGWSAYEYCNVQSYNGFTNPFLNNGSFDFAYYCNNNGYSNIDYVCINLGTNDVVRSGHNSIDEILSNFDKMVKSIRTFSGNIKILICLSSLPCSYDAQSQFSKNSMLNLILALKQKYENRQSEKIYVPGTYSNLDTENDFVFSERQISSRNIEMVKVVKDKTHPANCGYYKFSDVIYHWIKYIESMS